MKGNIEKLIKFKRDDAIVEELIDFLNDSTMNSSKIEECEKILINLKEFYKEIQTSSISNKRKNEILKILFNIIQTQTDILMNQICEII